MKGSTAKTLIIYDVDQTAEAVKQSFISRDHGIPAVTMRKSSRMDMDAYVDYCKKLNFDTLVYITGGDIIRKEF